MRTAGASPAPANQLTREASTAAHAFKKTGRRNCHRNCARADQPAGGWSSRLVHPLRCRQFGTIVTAREQVPVAVGRHLNRAMTKARLHHLEREFEAAIDAPVDAPAGVEMAQRVQAWIFCLPMFGDDAGSK